MRETFIETRDMTLRLWEYSNEVTQIDGVGVSEFDMCVVRSRISFANIEDDIWGGFHPWATDRFRVAVVRLICEQLYKDAVWEEVAASPTGAAE